MAMSTSLSMKVATTPMKARYITMKAFWQLEGGERNQLVEDRALMDRYGNSCNGQSVPEYDASCETPTRDRTSAVSQLGSRGV
jgi:hypothetical protein